MCGVLFPCDCKACDRRCRKTLRLRRIGPRGLVSSDCIASLRCSDGCNDVYSVSFDRSRSY